MDDNSSYMCSQNGSPLKKMRRTRDERKRMNNKIGKQKENVPTTIQAVTDLSLNISPVKKGHGNLVILDNDKSTSIVTPGRNNTTLLQINNNEPNRLIF